MPSIKKLLQAAAGNAGESLYVEDVFSTYLYTGTGATQTVTNGIDLDGEGGMVWTKGRNAAQSHGLWDTDRGVTKYLVSENTNAQATYSGLTAFNSNGFTLGSGNEWNQSGNTFASWTFRKAEKFFDVVTYTGTGSVQTIAHNLGVAPAIIITKKTSGTSNWAVNDPSQANPWSGALLLNSTNAFFAASTVWNDTAPTDSVFTVGTADATNVSGQTYVAYLFASDAGGFGDDGDESIIKCGSYTGNGSTDGPEINCGFEPQFLLLKASTLGAGANWLIYDSMRGFVTGGDDSYLRPNLSDAEGDFESGEFLANGFKLTATSGSLNGSGQDYIYIAIRRPMKTPESGTEVFATAAQAGGGTITTGFPTDLVIEQNRGGSGSTSVFDRLRSVSTTVYNQLNIASTAAENVGTGYGVGLQSNTQVIDNWFGSGSNIAYWMFKRATGFFDVVAYTGNGTAGRTVAHNLGVVPELMIVKQRPYTSSWTVYNKDIGAANKLVLDSTAALASATSAWNSTAPTETVFTLGSLNDTNENPLAFIAYLFATLAGVSKVGSYTGTGADLNVDCGFSAGARFILIKRTDSTGDWYVWDSARGIVAGNDPYLLLNSTAAEVTSTDYIDPLSSGFTVTSSASSTVNVSSGEYIFLAIA
jgi:hypothetical protein